MVPNCQWCRPLSCGEQQNRYRATPKLGSSFTAELLAISKAIELAETSDRDCVTIVSYSLSSIQSLEQLYSKTPVVLRIRGQLLNSSKSYSICWCPSHVGVRQNELADRISQFHAENGINCPVPLPRADFKAFVRLHSKRLWSLEWFSQPRTNKLRSFKSSTSPSCHHPTSADRYWERTLCRLRIGHSRLTHQYLMDQSPLPYCLDCLVPLTVFHFLIECPTYSDERRTCFGANPSYCVLMTLHAYKNGPLY